MEIFHHISLNADDADRRTLAALGIEGSGPLLSFDVAESDPRWAALSSWAARRNPVDVVSTRFTEAEIERAAWVAIRPAWHRGYPQPEDGYLQATYDLSSRCARCGIGAVQRAPFRMSGEPSWGRNGILQLNWVFDQYFATPEVHRDVFARFGVEARPVLDRRGARELATVVQLVAAEQVPLVRAEAPGDVCGACGRTKLLPHVRGPFPRLARAPRGRWAWSEEWFGSGAAAHHAVLAPGELVRALRERGVRGVSFHPVAG